MVSRKEKLLRSKTFQGRKKISSSKRALPFPGTEGLSPTRYRNPEEERNNVGVVGLLPSASSSSSAAAASLAVNDV